jgi:hypothetical protein
VFHPRLTLFEISFIGYHNVDMRVLGRMWPGEANGDYKIYSIISNEIRLLFWVRKAFYNWIICTQTICLSHSSSELSVTSTMMHALNDSKSGIKYWLQTKYIGLEVLTKSISPLLSFMIEWVVYKCRLLSNIHPQSIKESIYFRTNMKFLKNICFS